MVQLLMFIIGIPFKDASCYTDWLVTAPLVLIVFSLARAAFARTAFCMKLTHGLDLGSFPLLLHGLSRDSSPRIRHGNFYRSRSLHMWVGHETQT
jgi:hypothetical protein